MAKSNELTWDTLRDRLLDYQGGEFAAGSITDGVRYRGGIELITVRGSDDAQVFTFHCRWKAISRGNRLEWEIDNDDSDTIICKVEKTRGLREDPRTNRIYFDYIPYGCTGRDALRVTLHPRWGDKLDPELVRDHPDAGTGDTN